MPNPFVHIELSTGDVEAAKRFYLQVFDWHLQDIPAMGYTTINVGEGVGGGMQAKQAPEAPAAWMPYVEVADVKATTARAAAAGATVMVDYMPIGDMGAIGIFVDPTGAAIGVWESTAKPAAPAARKAPAKKAAARKAPAKKAAARPAKKPAKKAAKKPARKPAKTRR
jgi:predicted enzyme related to lactoylglutathione lyase